EDERERKPREIQHPPRAEPGDGQNRRVEYNKIAEQCDMTSGTFGSQKGREEPAYHGEQHDGKGALDHSQRRAERRDDGQQGEGNGGSQKRVEMERREYGEVEDADGTTLESQRITPPLQSQAPSENQ